MEKVKDIEIKHVENRDRGYFSASKEGRDAGLMTYVNVDSNRFIIDHTEVDEEFNGQGVGIAMVMESVDYARDNNLKILPLCAFAKAMFRKYPEINDVLYKP